jgi:carbonic anhydrase
VPLIFVLGHAKCGAVTAAVEGGHEPGHIGAIVESLESAVKAAATEKGDKVENAVCANATGIREALAACGPILAKEVKAGQVKIFAGRYDITTGEVGVLP